MSKSIGRLSRAYGRLQLRSKILLSYILLLVLLVVSLGIAALWQTSRLVDDKLLTAISGSVRQLGVHISYRMQIVINSSEMLSWDNDLRRILAYDQDAYPLSRQIDDIRVARERLLSVRLNRDVSAVRLYIRNGTLLSRERDTFFPLAELEEQSWYSRVLDSGGRAVWIGAKEGRAVGTSPITCVRCIRDTRKGTGCLGVLAIDIDPDVLRNVMQQSGLLREAEGLVLADANNRIVATAGAPPSEANREESGRYRVLESTLDFPDWKLLAFIQNAAIRAGKLQLIYSFLAILTVVTALAMILTLAISQRISERITSLTEVVSDPDAPRAAVKYRRYDDEITDLQDFLVGLVRRNRELLRAVYEEQVAEKEAKLQALQMQINPHFLYNTLDTINWMALQKNETEISTMVNLLARFYRLSISRGADVVTIGEELEQVRAFLEIYRTRYEGTIETDYNISDDVIGYKTVKLILQPLAENAIVHGISNTETQSGRIYVSAHEVNGHIELVVRDDGCGLGRAEYERILADPMGGFAIKNVDERIKMFSGPGYGLSFDFDVDRGTRAVVRLAKTR